MLYQLAHTEGHLQLVLNIFYKRTYVYNHVYCFSLNRCWSLRDQMLMPRDQTFWNYKVGIYIKTVLIMILWSCTCICTLYLCFSGEFQLKLRHLEKSLLQALNASKGKILDDDSIISHLETLKKEASEVARKVEETDVIMAEVETTSQQYVSLATSCSSIYFSMEALQQVTRKCPLSFIRHLCQFILQWIILYEDH